MNPKESSKFFLDNAEPGELKNALLCIKENETLCGEDFRKRFLDSGFSFGKKESDNYRRLVDLGLFTSQTYEKDSRKYFSLTPFGARIKKVLFVKEALFFELVHYLHYFKSLECEGREYFWTYKFIVDSIYVQKKVLKRGILLERLINSLQAKFQADKFAVDARSIGKVIKWVNSLEPCLVSKTGNVRYRQNMLYPELLLQAISYAYLANQIPFGYPLVLNGRIKEEICCFTFIDPTLIQPMIETLISKHCLRSNYGHAGHSIILGSAFSLEKWVEERFA